jgi:hypothetical protein
MEIDQVDFPTQADQVTGHDGKVPRGGEQFGQQNDRPGKLACLRPFKLSVQTP